MTDTPTQPPHDPEAVGIDVNAITGAYREALADETSRRILAEAMVESLKRERAELRQTIEALSPGAPSLEDRP